MPHEIPPDGEQAMVELVDCMVAACRRWRQEKEGAAMLTPPPEENATTVFSIPQPVEHLSNKEAADASD